MNASSLAAESAQPTWQCVLICWGTKYTTDEINNLVHHIATHATGAPRFVLITDEVKPLLMARVHTVLFPDYWLQAPLRRSGCQAKLVMFEKGILPEDLPAIYVDLDTIVIGDLNNSLNLMDSPRTVALLQSAIIPFGVLGRLCYRFSQGKHYARGNSSLVVFHPRHNHFIAEKFRAFFALYPAFEFRPMIADERFISWVAQPHMKAIPKSFAVKFSGEFMFYWAWWLLVRGRLPWVRRRREGLAVVTLAGLQVKPEKLLAMHDGDRVVDEKGRVLVWGRRTMGTMCERINRYYIGIF